MTAVGPRVVAEGRLVRLREKHLALAETQDVERCADAPGRGEEQRRPGLASLEPIDVRGHQVVQPGAGVRPRDPDEHQVRVLDEDPARLDRPKHLVHLGSVHRLRG